MVRNCINPRCEIKPNFFGAGALYAFPRVKTISARRRMQCFWLCAGCAGRYTVQIDAAGTPVVVPRTARDEQSNGAQKSRLVFQSTRVSLPVGKHESRQLNQALA